MVKHPGYLFFLVLPMLLQYSNDVQAQAVVSYDSSYFEAYPEQITSRFYFSRKFTGFHVEYDGLDQVFKYEPNTTRNMGIGASYKWFTLNLAYGFDFLNPDEGLGDTKYLDLQSHLYLGKYNVDLFGQFYKGYHLENDQLPGGETYLRPDLRVKELGVNVQYVFNHREFSFKAAFQNTEYQKRSAGSWLLGVDAFYGIVQADSSLVPGFYHVETPDFHRLRFLKGGPSAGYAYTLVISKNFYVTGSAYLAFNTGVYRLVSDEHTEDEFYVSLDYGLRLAAGYNSSRFNIGTFYVMQEVQAESNYKNIVTTGNFRVIAAYRFLKG